MRRTLFGIGSGRAAVALVTVVAACVIAGCGSASSSSGSATSTTGSASASSTGSGAAGGAAGSAQRTKLVACLKSHGVTLPSRPPGGFRPPAGGGSGTGTGTTGTGTTGTGTTGTGTTPRRGFFFGGGGRGFANNPKLQAAFKACGANFGAGGRGFRGRISHATIRKYVTCVRQHGYNLPAPNFSGKGPIFPANIQNNAKFQAASRACQNLLVPPRGAPGSGSGGTSTTSGA